MSYEPHCRNCGERKDKHKGILEVCPEQYGRTLSRLTISRIQFVLNVNVRKTRMDAVAIRQTLKERKQ